MGKKVAIIGVSSIFLVAMVVAVVVGVTRKPAAAAPSSAASSSGELSETAKAVQTLCQPTDYKEACERSLASANTTDPKELMKLSFKAAMHEVSLALNNSTELEKANSDDKTGQALKTCNEALDSAIDNLQQSFDKLGGFDLSKVDDYLNDVQTWLTSSYSYGVMCLDSFEWNTTESDKAKAEMEKALKSAKELTSNALVMVNQVEKVLGSLNIPISQTTSRRLLSEDGFPSWVSAGMRRLLKAPARNIRADVVVAKDGSGKYSKVSDAVKNIPVRKNNRMYVIHVKAGVYAEVVTIDKKQINVMIIGDGPLKTKITGRLNNVDGVGTFQTGTFKALGSNFIARDIGFENSAGSEKHQAVALHAGGDMSIFFNCKIDAFQDTLLTAAGRQFYRDCTISGTVDFIFGYASAIFQNCRMLIRKPMDNQQCMVTADGRENDHLASGIVIHNSVITAAPDMARVKGNFRSYLGRPWKPLARTVVINSQIDDVIHPDGWMPWSGSTHEKTCFYGEYGNRGTGANTNRRVRWGKKLTKNQALFFTVRRFIAGDKWIPKSGVPFVAGL
uniref:Pectinesterase n=1 Tax=Kalanchoe fedtschenkoi TaxID=63787 RepID=A0A7N0T753_KALFE